LPGLLLLPPLLLLERHAALPYPAAQNQWKHLVFISSL
jgi:hypothetical protein